MIGDYRERGNGDGEGEKEEGTKKENQRKATSLFLSRILIVSASGYFIGSGS